MFDRFQIWTKLSSQTNKAINVRANCGSSSEVIVKLLDTEIVESQRTEGVSSQVKGREGSATFYEWNVA